MSEEKALFENNFTPTKEHYVQAYRRVLFSWSKKQAVFMFAAFGVVAALAVISGLLSGGSPFNSENAFLYIMLLIIIALLCILYFWLPQQSAKNTMRQQQEGYAQPVSIETSFSEEKVCVLNAASKGEMNFSYDAFTRCTETEELLLVQTKSKQTLLLLKTGFTQGNEAEFKAFLRKKCPQARFSWK